MINNVKKKRINVVYAVLTLILAYIICIFIVDYLYTKANEPSKDAISTENQLVNNGLELSLKCDLKYDNGKITGNIMITNEGKDIINSSDGGTYLALGISTVDSANNIINLDYAHIPITDELIKKGKTVKVKVEFDCSGDLVTSGNKIRIAVLQECVAWDEKTAIYWAKE